MEAFSVTGEFPSQRPVTRSFGLFFDLRLNKQLSKQSRSQWFDTPSRYYDVIVMEMNDVWIMQGKGFITEYVNMAVKRSWKIPICNNRLKISRGISFIL